MENDFVYMLYFSLTLPHFITVVNGYVKSFPLHQA